MKEEIQYDEFGRTIFEKRPDGYCEETEYCNDGRVIHRIHYPNGQEEIERYGSIIRAS